VKSYLDLRDYVPIFGMRRKTKPDEDKPCLALRAEIGGTAGTLPLYEQFFVGGAESLRGYREDRYWGSNMFLASAEYRQPLARKLKGVLFIDAGDAWGGDYGNVQIAGFSQSGISVNVGAGFGIRVGTPIGPLRLDFGFGHEGARTHFSIGNVF
jgi:outer membrane protein insertion porin family